MSMEIRTRAKVAEVLAEPDAPGPENAYYMLRGHPNITVWEPGRYGHEFVKTHGHYHIQGQPETYKVVYGQGIAILQHRTSDGNVDQVWLFRVQAGDIVRVPAGSWGHAFCNTGPSYLITEDDAPSDASHSQNDYEAIKAHRGMAYYILDDGREVLLQQNASYGRVPEPVWKQPE